MRSLPFILFIICHLLCKIVFTSHSEDPPESVMRISISKENLGKKMQKITIEEMENMGEKLAFPDINQMEGKGLFRAGLILENILTDNFKYIWDNSMSPEISKDRVKFTYNKDVMSMDVGFTYIVGFLSSYWFWGNGSVHLESKGVEMGNIFPVEAYNPNKCMESWVLPLWDFQLQRDLSLHDGLLKNNIQIRKWVGDLITMELLYRINYELHKWGGGANIGCKFMREYLYSQTIYDALPIVLQSALIYITSDSQSLNVLFYINTNVIIQDRAYNSTIFRKLLYTQPTSNGTDIQICIPTGIIPTIIGLRGFARDFYTILTHKIAYLSPTIRTFGEFIPGLLDNYPAQMGVNIGCRMSPWYPIVDIKPLNTSPDRHYIQIPVLCEFAVNDNLGNTILTTTHFVRGEYAQLKNHPLGAFIYELRDLYLYGYQIPPQLSDATYTFYRN